MDAAGTQAAMEEKSASPESLAEGVVAKAIPGRGIGAFAAKDFAVGDCVFIELAIFVSSLAVPRKENKELHVGLLEEMASRRLPDFDPGAHLGALVALRDLGQEGCQRLLRTKCHGCDPEPRLAKLEAGVLRKAVARGLVPQAAVTFPPPDYARLRMSIQMNGFRFNGDVKKGEPGYDTGEVMFDKICRINHSCSPNLEFDLSWDSDQATVVNTVTAIAPIAEGDELRISYLPLRLGLPVKERRRQLHDHWGFDCDCPRCIAEGGPPVTRRASAERASEPEVKRQSAKDDTADAGSSDSEAGICWDDLADPDEKD